MNYWWVNQSSSYRDEVPGGYMWMPSTTPSYVHWYNMLKVKRGDVVFSHADSQIKAVGLVMMPAVTAFNPRALNTPRFPSGQTGLRVKVLFTELSNPVPPKDHMNILGPTCFYMHSPLKLDGTANEGYLYNVSPKMAEVLTVLLDEPMRLLLRAHGLLLDNPAEETVAEKEPLPEVTAPESTLPAQLISLIRLSPDLTALELSEQLGAPSSRINSLLFGDLRILLTYSGINARWRLLKEQSDGESKEATNLVRGIDQSDLQARPAAELDSPPVGKIGNLVQVEQPALPSPVKTGLSFAQLLSTRHKSVWLSSSGNRTRPEFDPIAGFWKKPARSTRFLIGLRGITPNLMAGHLPGIKAEVPSQYRDIRLGQINLSSARMPYVLSFTLESMCEDQRIMRTPIWKLLGFTWQVAFLLDPSAIGHLKVTLSGQSLSGIEFRLDHRSGRLSAYTKASGDISCEYVEAGLLENHQRDELIGIDNYTYGDASNAIRAILSVAPQQPVE